MSDEQRIAKLEGEARQLDEICGERWRRIKELEAELAEETQLCDELAHAVAAVLQSPVPMRDHIPKLNAAFVAYLNARDISQSEDDLETESQRVSDTAST